MATLRLARMSIVALALTAAACLDTTNPDQTNGAPPMSAMIEGTPWYATGILVTPTPTSITLGGGNSQSNAAVSVVINATAPGTYTLGPGNTSSGVIGITTGQVWSTDGDSASGTIVVTTFANRHIAGTFEFAAVPSTGGATGTVHVTSGKFDINY
jgi:hypothetical protein